ARRLRSRALSTGAFRPLSESKPRAGTRPLPGFLGPTFLSAHRRLARVRRADRFDSTCMIVFTQRTAPFIIESGSCPVGTEAGPGRALGRIKKTAPTAVATSVLPFRPDRRGDRDSRTDSLSR